MFLCSASNFLRRKLEVELKKICIGLSWSFQAWSSKAQGRADTKKLSPKDGGQTQFSCTQHVWEIPNSKLGISQKGQKYFLCIRAPTFGLKSLKPSATKKIKLGMYQSFRAWSLVDPVASELEAPTSVEEIFLVIDHQLLAPKIGG